MNIGKTKRYATFSTSKGKDMDKYFWNDQNFILADNEFVGRLSSRSAERYSSFFYNVYQSDIGPTKKSMDKENFLTKMNQSMLKFIISYCPFCNNVILICEIYLSMDDVRQMSYCPVCGEADFMIKAIRYREDIDEFIKVTRNSTLSEKSLRLIKNQLVVMISTQIECFTKDYYSAILNMRLIKFRQSSYERFLRDCGNDFINPHKTNSRMKKELDIDLKNLIGIDDFNSFVRLSALRNVIVHNNGRADRSYLVNNDEGLLLGDVLNVSDEDIDSFRHLYRNLVVRLMGEYRKDFLPRLLHDADVYSDDVIYNSAFLNRGKTVYFRDIINANQSNDA